MIPLKGNVGLPYKCDFVKKKFFLLGLYNVNFNMYIVTFDADT